MDIRPIRTDEDYEWALAEVERYFEDLPEVGSAEGDRFDVLSDLIAAYEEKHYPIEPVEPIELIKAHMEMTAHSQSDLAALLGSAPRASEILNKKRPLTVAMVDKLSTNWGLPADWLVKPYHLAAE